LQKLVEELRAKLSKTLKETLSAEERSKLMEETVQGVERQQETLKNQIAQTSALKMRKSDELGEMKLHKRDMDTEIQVPWRPLATEMDLISVYTTACAAPRVA